MPCCLRMLRMPPLAVFSYSKRVCGNVNVISLLNTTVPKCGVRQSTAYRSMHTDPHASALTIWDSDLCIAYSSSRCRLDWTSCLYVRNNTGTTYLDGWFKVRAPSSGIVSMLCCVHGRRCWSFCNGVRGSKLRAHTQLCDCVGGWKGSLRHVDARGIQECQRRSV